jgi:hypothetical protein
MNLSEETLRALSCDITIRPGSAPGVDALMPFVRELKTQDGVFVVNFDKASKTSVQAFVEAERLCCTSLSWKIKEEDDTVELQIQGTPEQVSIIRQWFDPSNQNAEHTNLAQ